VTEEIGAENSWCIKRTHQFSLEIRKSVKQAHEIGAKNGNLFWRDAIFKEM